MNQTETPTPSAPPSEPVVNKTAAFLFDEPNEVFDAFAADAPVSTPVAPGSPPTNDAVADLARQAAQAQRPDADLLDHLKPGQPAAPVQPAPVQQAPVQQQPAAPVLPQVPALPPLLPPLPIQQQAVPPVAPQAPVYQPPVQQQQYAPPAQPSQEDIHRSLNIYKLTEADYDSVFNVDDKQQSIKALDGILQNVVRQALTMAHTLHKQEISQFEQKVQPYMHFADEQRHTAMEQAFYSRHADLQQSAPVVTAVLKQFQAAGAKFPTAEALFDAVAQHSKAYLTQLVQLGQTAPQQAPAPVVQPNAVKPRMAALPTGGQGGSGGGQGQSGQMSTAQKLFS